MRRKHSVMGIVLLISMIINIFPIIKVSAASFTPRYSLSYEDTQSKYWASGTYGVSNGFPRNWNSGYSGGNCTWYAFGRAWELLGTLPNLCTNNAGAWYSYNKSHGYYPYGSIPKLGAIACWDHYDNDTGHVAVVEEIGSDYIVCSESGWSYTNGYFSTKTRSLNDSTLGMGSSYRFLGYIYIGNFSPDTTPPTITSLTVTNKSTSSFTVNCTADETLSRAYMIVYGPGGNSGNGFDINNINSTSFSKTIYTSDYGGNGTYTVHIYVFDNAGNSTGGNTGSFTLDNISISSFTVSNITSSSFRINCTATQKMSKVYIIVYGPGGNSGNGFTIENINSTSYSRTISTSDYGGIGEYVVHIYVFDSSGNSVGGNSGRFTVEPMKVESYTATNITDSSFVLTGRTNEVMSKIYIIVYGPGGSGGNGFTVENINSKYFNYKINISDYGGQGSYVAHLYAFDKAGNSVGARTEKFYVPQSLGNPSTTTTATRVNGTIEVQTNISNLSQNASCVAAVYDSNGVLIGQTANDVNSSTNSVTSYFPNYSNVSYVKVFLWGSLQGMKPLTDGEKVNIQ